MATVNDPSLAKKPKGPQPIGGSAQLPAGTITKVIVGAVVLVGGAFLFWLWMNRKKNNGGSGQKPS